MLKLANRFGSKVSENNWRNKQTIMIDSMLLIN